METTGDTADWPLVVLGDHRAFERVFDRHADLVFRFVRRRTGDEDLAEDVTAQVFFEAWRQRSKVQPLNGSLRSWLLGVAGNLVRRQWRTKRRKDKAMGRLPLPATTEDHAEQVAERLDDQQRLNILRGRLESLPRAQAEVLLLWAWEQLSYEEIASALKIPVGTVRSRLSRARVHLARSDGTQTPERQSLGQRTRSADPQRSRR